MEVRAKAKFVKTAPRKVRLVCDTVRGKNIEKAIDLVSFIKKQAAEDVLSLLKSVLANAKQKDLKPSELTISKIFCDEGPVLKRSIMLSRGRMSPIKKRMSHITVVLSEQTEVKTENAKVKTNNNKKENVK